MYTTSYSSYSRLTHSGSLPFYHSFLDKDLVCDVCPINTLVRVDRGYTIQYTLFWVYNANTRSWWCFENNWFRLLRQILKKCNSNTKKITFFVNAVYACSATNLHYHIHVHITTHVHYHIHANITTCMYITTYTYILPHTCTLPHTYYHIRVHYHKKYTSKVWYITFQAPYLKMYTEIFTYHWTHEKSIKICLHFLNFRLNNPLIAHSAVLHISASKHGNTGRTPVVICYKVSLTIGSCP